MKKNKKQKSDLIEVHEIPKGESYTANAEINLPLPNNNYFTLYSK